VPLTAVHNQMLNDQPHLFFVHFWANEDVRKLTTGLKAALVKINTGTGASSS